MAVERTYFEDVTTGERVDTPGMTVTEAHVSLYRGLAGELTDDPAEVPTLLPLCLATGLNWRLARPPLAVQAFVGFEWETLKPVRLGDTICGRARAVHKRSMRDAGVIVEDHEVVDQHGDVVQRGRFTFLVAKRPT